MMPNPAVPPPGPALALAAAAAPSAAGPPPSAGAPASFRALHAALRAALARGDAGEIAGQLQTLAPWLGPRLLAYAPPSQSARGAVQSGAVDLGAQDALVANKVQLNASDVRLALALSDALHLDERACVALLVKAHRERGLLTVASAAGIHMEERQAAIASVRLALQASLFDTANAADAVAPAVSTILGAAAGETTLVSRLCALIRSDDAVRAGSPADDTPGAASALDQIDGVDGTRQPIASVVQHERALLCECLLLACAAQPVRPADAVEVLKTLQLLVARWRRCAHGSADAAGKGAVPGTPAPWAAWETEASASLHAALVLLLCFAACVCPPSLATADDAAGAPSADFAASVRAVLDDARLQELVGARAADGAHPKGAFGAAALLAYGLARWRDRAAASDAAGCDAASATCLAACERGAIQLFADAAVPLLCGLGAGAARDSVIRAGLGTRARAASHTLEALVTAAAPATASASPAALSSTLPPLWHAIEDENPAPVSAEALRSQLCGNVLHAVLVYLSSTPIIVDLHGECVRAPPKAPPAAPPAASTGVSAPTSLSGDQAGPIMHLGWFDADMLRSGSPSTLALTAMDDGAPGVEPGDCFHAVLRFAEAVFTTRPEIVPHASISLFLDWVASLSELPPQVSDSEGAAMAAVDRPIERPRVVTAQYLRVLAACAASSTAPGSNATGRARSVFEKLLSGSTDAHAEGGGHQGSERVSWLKLYTVVKIYDRQFMSIEAAKATANAGGQGGGGLSLVAAGGASASVGDTEAAAARVMTDEDADVLCAYLLCLRRCLEGAAPTTGAAAMVDELTRFCCNGMEHPADPLASLLPRPCPPRVKAALMECVTAFAAAGSHTAIAVWLRMSEIKVAGGDVPTATAAAWGGAMSLPGPAGTAGASVGGVAYELAAQESREGLYPVTIAALRTVRALLAASDGAAIDASCGGAPAMGDNLAVAADSNAKGGAEALLRFPWASALRGWSRRVHL